MIREIEYKAPPGLLTMLLLALVAVGGIALFFYGARNDVVSTGIAGLVIAAAAAACLAGVFVVQPNEGKVITLFGRYVGTEKRAGIWYANPFTQRKRISLRTRNFETAKLKVNDSNSNPIEIGAIVVWKVVETAEASFEVDNYEQFVQVQSEAAVRALATHYPYDTPARDEIALSTHIEEVSVALAEALRERLGKAGVEVIEARISHLAYASEIAATMLRRQQASAIIAARAQIVDGAVGMVEHALELLSQKNIIELDDERKAQMVSNLLVVLCSDHDAQPVVNTGSIHQ
jgi:regulator of protease activity HflC (stomatin/prohibitin superfamily)